MLPAEVTPAMVASPSCETKYRSMKKYSVWTKMPMAMVMDIVAMCPGMEPVLRSLMGRATYGQISIRTKEKAGHLDRPSPFVVSVGLIFLLLDHCVTRGDQSPQGNVVMTPTRKRASLLFTSGVTLPSPSVPVNLPNSVKLL